MSNIESMQTTHELLIFTNTLLTHYRNHAKNDDNLLKTIDKTQDLCLFIGRYNNTIITTDIISTTSKRIADFVNNNRSILKTIPPNIDNKIYNERLFTAAALLFEILINYYMANIGDTDRLAFPQEVIEKLATFEAHATQVPYLNTLINRAKLFSFQHGPIALKDINNIISENQEKLSQQVDRANTAHNDLKIEEATINELTKKIKGLKSEFNFVGLSHGFTKIYKKKKDENNAIIGVLGIIALAMISIPVGMYFFNNSQNQDAYSINYLIHITPLFTIEVILLYFFRVILHQLNNVKAVLLQVDQRLNLCQFFESYIEYAEKQKDNKERFEKFESLIFSGLLMDQSQLPSTFDGLDNLSKLIGSIKNKP
ncbi:hypothetical protein [Laribacter hongkongensis]|uniref:hypothetical protein n=1 Tax=Laribacter hongkongensis TaxID=168471 RepID=UPI001EFD75A3|nr:hypothetical protein [Laribacter hongkongensis]MCG9078969.1 hypothetical protein [Laribacter hongkongensis]